MLNFLSLTRKEFKLLSLIFLLALIPRLWRIHTDLQIHFDQGLHSFAIWDIWHERKLSLLGHQTDTDGIFHGPIYYWFMIPAYAIGGGDPGAAAIFQILLHSLAIFFLFSLAKQLFNSQVALLSSFLYAVSYGYISYSRWLSNVTPVLPFSIVFFWFLYYLYQGKINLLPAVTFLASLLTQFHAASGVFLSLVVFFILISKRLYRQVSFRIALLSLITFIIPHLPLLAFELRHNFVVSQSVLKLSRDQSSGLGFSIPVFQHNFQTFLTELVHLTSFPFAWMTIIPFVISVFLLLRNRFFTLIILPFFFFLSLYRRGTFGFFFMPLFPLFTILFSNSILLLPKILKYILLVTLVAINLSLWKNFLYPTHALTPIGAFNLITSQDRKNVVDWVYQDASGQPFALWIYTIPYFLDQPWSYYFVWYGQDKYGYQPEKIGSFSPGDLKSAQIFYNIYEPDDDRPTRLESWLDEVNKNFGPVVGIFSSNDARVERRTWPNK